MDKIEELLTRGVANIIPSKAELKKLLGSSKKLNIYLGIDPTAVNIHLGHAVALRKLQQFADLGHNVTFLVGDFTALIGDTSDKESERPQLTTEEIKKNLETYKEQSQKILDFEKVKIKFNSEWLSLLKLEDILKLSSHFSFNDFLSRELIKKRLSEGQHIGFQEFMYPIMQGYDSYHLDTDIQLGGTDQTFNMQSGRTLIKDLKNKESFIMANNFLTGTDGRKMSKTWGNAIWLTDNETEMFGKIMSIKDELIVEYFTLATDVPMDEIRAIDDDLKKGQNAMQHKKRLAKTIVSMFHGDKKAEEAEAGFQKVVQEGKAPEDIQTLKITDNHPLSKFVIEQKLVESMGEWKRLIEQHGVTIDEERIENPFINTKSIKNGGTLKIGKRRYAKIEKN